MPGADDHVSEAPTYPLAESRGVVALLLTVIPLSQIPLDAYTPAMPDMVRDLVSSNTLVQNTVTVYVLGMCLALIPLGMLADSWGRKGTLLTGLLLLMIASLGCAAATEIWTLLAFRLLQGLAAATCMVVPYAVAADLFRGPQLTSISGLLGIAWGLAPVVAPAVGGLLVQYLSWRFVFAGIAIMAGSIGALAFLRLPETLPIDRRVPFHPAGAGKVLFAALANIRLHGRFWPDCQCAAGLRRGCALPLSTKLGTLRRSIRLDRVADRRRQLGGGGGLHVAGNAHQPQTALLRCPIGLPSRDASSSAQRSASGRIVLPHHLGRHAGPRRMRNPLPDHVWNGAWTFLQESGIARRFH